MKKPFFWYLINKPFSSDLIEEFALNYSGNTGLVIHDQDIEKIDTSLFGLLHNKYKIPLAIYISKKDSHTPSDRDIFYSKIYRFSKEIKSLKKSESVCFKIAKPQKQKMASGEFIDQLSAYFSYKGAFPKSEAVVEIEKFSPIIHKPEFFLFLQKLGISCFMIPFSMKNKFHDFQNNSKNEGSDKSENINLWRDQIDVLDNILIDILKQRMQIVQDMGNFKKQHDLTFFNAHRWHDILTSRKKTGKAANIDEELIEKIFEAIHLNNLKSMLG